MKWATMSMVMFVLAVSATAALAAPAKQERARGRQGVRQDAPAAQPVRDCTQDRQQLRDGTGREQNGPRTPTRRRVQDPTCPNCECPFIADGVCQACGQNCVPQGPDDDGDGIPNGQDDDYVPPRDGSGPRGPRR